MRRCFCPLVALLDAPNGISPLPGCRVISRAPGLKLVVETLISSLRPIGNIVLICCAFFIIFGILGVQVCGPGLSRVCPTLGLCSPLAGWVLPSLVGGQQI